MVVIKRWSQDCRKARFYCSFLAALLLLSSVKSKAGDRILGDFVPHPPTNPKCCLDCPG